MKLTDDELLDELNNRFHQNKQSLEELQAMTAQLKELNHKLEDSEKLKSHFLSNIRNEIINPFASIIGLARNIQTLDSSKLNKIKSMAAMIQSEAFMLDFQLQNIFAAAEIEAGNLNPEYMPVEINGLIDSVISSFAHEINKKKIEIKMNICCEHFNFRTDPEKFRIVISNILSNAIKYSHDNNHVEIDINKIDSNLIIKIKDHGIGMAQEDVRIIFDRFKRVDSTINTLNSGHGLGLSVARALIDIIGGEIDVETEREKGSLFIVTIPEAQSAEGMAGLAMDGNEFLFETDGELF